MLAWPVKKAQDAALAESREERQSYGPVAEPALLALSNPTGRTSGTGPLRKRRAALSTVIIVNLESVKARGLTMAQATYSVDSQEIIESVDRPATAILSTS